MSVEQNKATLKRLYEEVWNKGNLSLMPEMVSPDYHYGEYRGLDGYRQVVTMQRNAFPDVRFTIDQVIGEGDWLAYHLTTKGTLKGKLLNIEPTGKEATWKRAFFSQFKEGKLAAAVAVADNLTFYQQIGVKPPGFDQAVEKNKASMHRCFEEVWNKGALAVIPEVISPDYVGQTAASTTRGLAAFEQSVRNGRAAMPDLHYAIDSVVGEGDTLAIRLTLTGTFTGKMGDTAPTGKRLNLRMALFNRYADGKCIESIYPGNRQTANQQLGIPEPAA